MHEVRLLFAREPALFGADRTAGREPGRRVQPARQRRMPAQRASFARDQYKDGLRDVVRAMHIATQLSQRRVIDHVGALRDLVANRAPAAIAARVVAALACVWPTPATTPRSATSRIASSAPGNSGEIVTEIRVRYGPDGAVIGLPAVVAQRGVTPLNSSYAGRMAEAARLAVLRCAPIPIPPGLAEVPWHEIDLVFSPRRRV